MARQLPNGARIYLRKHADDAKTHRVVHLFHNWLDRHQWALSALDVELVDSFFEKPFHRKVRPQTAQGYKRALIGYLDWLYDKDRINFDPKELSIRRRRPLPESATAYTRTLTPTHKPSSIRGITTSLRRFYDWLADSRLRLRGLRRAQIEQWFLSLHDESLAAATRRDMLTNVRNYLRWANDRGEFRPAADDLIRNSDLPKLPRYLPRPLLPEEDRSLQRRLRDEGGLHARGLLLMRWTGLRIGELIRLEFNCIHEDDKGNSFIHVPLGKMNNERLVPVDGHTRTLIDEIRASREPAECRFLLEDSAGRPTRYVDYRATLKTLCQGLETTEPVTSHRLRHTYATTMLGAGMSLTSVMRLLGHVDYRMTLRYAAITQPRVTAEYAEAITKIESRYSASLPSTATPDAVQLLSEVMRWVRAEIGGRQGDKKAARSLLRRIDKIQRELRTRIQVASR